MQREEVIMKKIGIVVAILLLVSVGANAKVRFGPQIGVFHGMGLGIQSGSVGTNFELSAGYQPVFLFISNTSEFRLISTADFSAGVFSTKGGADKRFRPGFLATAHYNTTLGFGLGAGFKGIMTAGKMDVNVNAGLKFYFNGQANLEEQENLLKADFLNSSLVIGLGVGLMF
jgi:hypothetical protein